LGNRKRKSVSFISVSVVVVVKLYFVIMGWDTFTGHCRSRANDLQLFQEKNLLARARELGAKWCDRKNAHWFVKKKRLLLLTHPKDRLWQHLVYPLP
jgi:hypothetical protein